MITLDRESISQAVETARQLAMLMQEQTAAERREKQLKRAIEERKKAIETARNAHGELKALVYQAENQYLEALAQYRGDLIASEDAAARLAAAVKALQENEQLLVETVEALQEELAQTSQEAERLRQSVASSRQAALSLAYATLEAATK